jgi:2-keto-3-deoxy-L-rhamnonate aldolase RhmA
VQAAIAQAFRTANAAGKAAGVLAADGKAEHYFEAGATMVGVGTDLHLLIAGADAVAARYAQR